MVKRKEDTDSLWRVVIASDISLLRLWSRKWAGIGTCPLVDVAHRLYRHRSSLDVIRDQAREFSKTESGVGKSILCEDVHDGRGDDLTGNPKQFRCRVGADIRLHSRILRNSVIQSNRRTHNPEDYLVEGRS